MKYETPQLIEIGNADRVILGVAGCGYDLDGALIMGDFEFYDDTEAE
jgi:hypothetical protein